MTYKLKYYQKTVGFSSRISNISWNNQLTDKNKICTFSQDFYLNYFGRSVHKPLSPNWVLHSWNTRLDSSWARARTAVPTAPALDNRPVAAAAAARLGNETLCFSSQVYSKLFPRKTHRTLSYSLGTCWISVWEYRF